jgi:hypothetical protein
LELLALSVLGPQPAKFNVCACQKREKAASARASSTLRKNAVDFNPVKGAKRPKVESNEGRTPALGDHQARALLDAPDPATLKGLRDRALLSVLLYHGLRRTDPRVSGSRRPRRGTGRTAVPAGETPAGHHPGRGDHGRWRL